MKVKIRGKVWNFERRKERGAYGTCDDPKAHKKAMTVDPALTGLGELQTILHESIHSALWDLSEEAVDETSIDIGKLLWRLGYRKINDVGH